MILAFDVSNSMRADDLEPTRIQAAKAAATAFAERQPSTIRIGVVAFSDSAVTVLRPTDVTEEVVAAIRRSRRAADVTRSGTFTSLSTIAGKPLQIDESALESEGGEVDIGPSARRPSSCSRTGEHVAPRPLAARRAGVLGGRTCPHDRDRNPGRDGPEIDGFSVATALDEEQLTEIADVTDGSYNRAGDTATLASIYESVDLELERVEREREVTACSRRRAGSSSRWGRSCRSHGSGG